MPRLIAFAALVVTAACGVLYLSGAGQIVTQWALDGQRMAQDGMARGLRSVRAGEGAALTGFLAVCFGYGFFHAAGPGHGKLLIGGYGAAQAVGALRLSLVALVSSLAQGASAIALVGAGLWLFALGRAAMTDLADRVLTPLSFAAIAVIGLWLVWRGLRGLWALSSAAQGRSPNHHHDHDPPHHHHHSSDAACAQCGHAHAPDPVALAAATGWRDMAALIGAIAIRPCTGALFILILTAQMGMFGIGVAGTLAMALGTASVTIAVALAAVTLRRGVLVGLADRPVLARVQPMLEITVGAIVAGVAGQVALAAL
jgi:ABC-type nickel/cobalt efflux system permease component RcnA